MKELIYSKEVLMEMLWKSDPSIFKILKNSTSTSQARESLFNYLNMKERMLFYIYSKKQFKNLHIIKKNNAKECIRVFKNSIRTENERLTNSSALKRLYGLAHKPQWVLEQTSLGFIYEFIALFKGINGNAEISNELVTIPQNSEQASQIRSEKLNQYSEKIDQCLNRYAFNLNQSFDEEHKKRIARILDYFNASQSDWDDYLWHYRHTLKRTKDIAALVKLSQDELDGLLMAEKHSIPFEITPYYLSLFNPEGLCFDDRAVRAQVLPSRLYCKNLISNQEKNLDMDFMGEKSTSPIPGITRRYPQIVILKPINYCPQICVYCQRNWELDPEGQSKINKTQLLNAVNWIKSNKSIHEVLVTGGDPLLFNDDYIDFILENLSKVEHIERIRIGTRVPVTVPFRITDQLVKIFKKYHVFGVRELAIVTHFEHSAEITFDTVEAIKKLRYAGLSVYNQEVYTYYNSFRYETVALRKLLKKIGIDPYYSFNTKGKEETIDFRVPIARIEQEREEEARFLPGLVRTDEPVFNVPKLGKSHLRAWQKHEVIMIMPDGNRVYRFFPWESNVTLVDDYLYTDVTIFQYLQRLEKDNEPLDAYKSIWYYF